ELLGYSPTQQALDYIIKKDGVLDEAGMTITLYDFPIIQTWVENQPEFDMLSDFNNEDGYTIQWRKVNKIKANQSCKYPVYAFYDADTEITGAITHNNGGSFFEMANTT